MRRPGGDRRFACPTGSDGGSRWGGLDMPSRAFGVLGAGRRAVSAPHGLNELTAALRTDSCHLVGAPGGLGVALAVALLPTGLGTSPACGEVVLDRHRLAAFDAVPPLQDLHQDGGVPAGDRGQTVPGRAGLGGLGVTQVGAQVGGLEEVRSGQALDKRCPPLARAGTGLDGQLSDRDRGPRGAGHQLSLAAVTSWGVSAATSSGTASRDSRVIRSVPVRIASSAAPRI